MAKKDLIKKPVSPKPTTTRPTLGGFLALRPRRHSTHKPPPPPHGPAVRRASTSGHHRPALADTALVPSSSAPVPAAAAAAAAASAATPAYRLRLVDLDHAHSAFDVRVASTILVAKLEETIRQRTRKHPLGPNDAVRLYRLNRPGSSSFRKDSPRGLQQLPATDVVGRVCTSTSTASHTTLYYRVQSADAESRHGHHYFHVGHSQRLRFRVDWLSEGTNKTKADSQRDHHHRAPSADVLRQLARDILRDRKSVV